jgi:hypothetical protein
MEDTDDPSIEFIPTPEQIKETSREIREEGFTDRHGRCHPPWPAERISTRQEPEPVETQVITGFGNFVNHD